MKIGRYRWPPSDSRRSTIGWFDGTSTRTPTSVTRITTPPPHSTLHRASRRSAGKNSGVRRSLGRPATGPPGRAAQSPFRPRRVASDAGSGASLVEVPGGGLAQEHGAQRAAQTGQVDEVGTGLRPGVGVLAPQAGCDHLV